MDNIRLQSLHPVFRDQEAKLEGMRNVVAQAGDRHEAKMENYAKAAYDKTVEIRSLKHNFSTNVHLDPAPNSIFMDTVASLQDHDSGQILHRLPTVMAMELGRKSRVDNVQRIIDILV